MSLLDSSNEWVHVHPEKEVPDADGNTVLRADLDSTLLTRARIWPLSSTEKDDQTTQRFGLRFPRSFLHVIGAQAQIVWNDKRYSVVGDPITYNGSPRTRHLQYVIERR